MKASIILQKGDTTADYLRKVDVDVAAFLDTAFQIRFVEIGKREACVLYGASELVVVTGGRVVYCVVDGGAADGGDLSSNWSEGGGG